MAETDTALPPIEIPWRLAATTQPLSIGAPAQTAMSLFFFEPEDVALTSEFSDDKLIFIKITATVSPASFPPKLSKVVASFLGEGIPCMHLLLDLKVRDTSGEVGKIRPYFHAAAPLARRFVQTGVIGAEAYEGEAEGIAIGKSGMQVNETLRSHSNTNSSSASAGLTTFLPIPIIPSLLSVGGSVRSTSTDVASDRAVSQAIDTTSRNAADERRELISHTTRVENIISLLNAKYVGTPYLSFSLSPPPLQQLSIDASDPNLWFQQLLARRSSGIEGIQEFTAVLVVPKDTDFCINAKLRRVCLLDSPPAPLSYDERFNGSLLQLARMVNYLNRTFPPGTPLEELDIDIIGNLSGGNFRRPVIELWGLRLLENLVVANVVSPGPSAGISQSGRANYKHMLEVWLETLRDEYEREVSRSPLERGILLGENRFLDTCFGTSPDNGATVVTDSTATVSALFPVDIRNGLFDIGGLKTLSTSSNNSTRSRASEVITRWTAIERQLTTLLSNGIEIPETPLSANHPKVVNVLLDTWRKLAVDDPLNLDFEKAAALLHLNDVERRQLKSNGARNLADIAMILSTAPEVEQHNHEVQKLRSQVRSRNIEGAPPDPIKFAVAAKESAEILNTIASHLVDTQ
jgi:hypothetical protein